MKQILISFLSRFVKDNPKICKLLQVAVILLGIVPHLLKHFNVGNEEAISLLTSELVHSIELVLIAALQVPNASKDKQ